jgi:glutamate formiminotransferase
VGQDGNVLECVVNVSEGARPELVDLVAAAAGGGLLDVHHDPHHNRAVLTLVGVEAPRDVARAAVERLDLRVHRGVHPRLGVVDVVPFIPLVGSTMADAVRARDAFAAWASSELGVPCFLYGEGTGDVTADGGADGDDDSGGGTGRSLPEIRRRAWRDLLPDIGPPAPHLTAGAMCVGARPVLVAYNVWINADVAAARAAAATVRGPHLRALGLPVGDRVQVSMNLIAPDLVGPAEAYDRVAALVPVDGAELVGLLPRSVLERAPVARWPELDLAEERTIESRLAAIRISP